MTCSTIASRRSAFALIALASLLVGACTGLRPGFETPTVTVTSFRMLPSTGVAPQFEIGLRVLNPNREALKLAGVSYTASIDGQPLIKGVSNQLPAIEGYGSGDITLTAAPNLLAGVRLITNLMNGPRDTVSYELEAKLDVGTFLPAIRVRDAGEISLGPSSN